MTPAEELRAAAEKLRTLAAEASEGPWTANQWGNVETAAYEEVAEVWPLQTKPGVNVTYIAAMHPGVGAALADWLHAMATWAAQYPEMAHDHDRPACDDYACNVMGRGIDLARQILGSQP